MTDRLPLLIELGCEELPVKALPGLARSLYDGVCAGLRARGLAFDEAEARSLYTPRRLAVSIAAVDLRQPDQAVESHGPYVNIALDADGQPTRALQGFASKAGVDWTALARTTDAKGERFVHRAVTPGAATAELLPDLLAEAIQALPIPKPMRWGDHEHAFARPVHWLVLLLGGDVVPCQLLGVRSDRWSRGHRFHHPDAIAIDTAQSYPLQLEAARVLVDADRRRRRIREQVDAAASAAGGSARIDDGVLEEVNCLVEWPVAVAGSFDRDFLRVPQEALILTMETNQKFFPVLDGGGRLTEHFIGIANIESSDPAQVRQGYERVIRPRFADARFFYDEDLKQGLSAMNASLAAVTYQAKLGSIADKVGRVAELAAAIAPAVGVDPVLARRAAGLAKADLQSRLVNEFPELQGIAGRYYAIADSSLADLSDGDRGAVAAAMDEAYTPRFAGDAIAPSPLGRVLAIAERLDTLAGGFAAGLKPTGNKDPFALRRTALGLARTLIEARLDHNDYRLIYRACAAVSQHVFSRKVVERDVLNLEKQLDDLRQFGAVRRANRKLPTLAEADAPSAESINQLTGEIYDFMVDRLANYFAELGVSENEFEAVAHSLPTSFFDFDLRLRAVGAFAGSEDGQALAAANKRCGNLLRKAREGGEPVPEGIDPALFEGAPEAELAAALAAAEAQAGPLFDQRRYGDALARLAALRPAVDAFFDQVMVMADDPAVRGNRLALLARLQAQFLRIADISRLAGG